MPFVTAGDPDWKFTQDVVRELAERGCDICELGIPYSDPIADGPVIQASFTRAVAAPRRTLTTCFTAWPNSHPRCRCPS